MPDVLIRDVPESVLETLKQRAMQHRLYLQQELSEILGAAAQQSSTRTPAEIAATIRSRLAQGGRKFSDSTAVIPEDRDRR
ncbi:MAG TPA: hypothetical protein VNL16_13100 [Chloroflexota bacterium]|nr:hypothetical protein [Chloroflexota bacterium]